MKKIAAAGLITAALLGITASVTSLVLPAINQKADGSSSQTEVAPVYQLREYEGRIGVFLDGSPDPYDILEVPVELLPEYDRELLREGITVTDETELNSLIEDFIG